MLRPKQGLGANESRWIILSLFVLVVLFGCGLGAPGTAHAQSALDGFNPNANGPVYSIAVQADGKILVGGYFTSLGGKPRNRIGRLNPNGNLDTSFNPGANNDVNSIAVQSDGKILVGGLFTALGGETRNYIGRLTPMAVRIPPLIPTQMAMSFPLPYSQMGRYWSGVCSLNWTCRHAIR